MTSAIREVGKSVVGLLWYNWCCFRSLSIAVNRSSSRLSADFGADYIRKKNRAPRDLLYTYRTGPLNTDLLYLCTGDRGHFGLLLYSIAVAPPRECPRAPLQGASDWVFFFSFFSYQLLRTRFAGILGTTCRTYILFSLKQNLKLLPRTFDFNPKNTSTYLVVHKKSKNVRSSPHCTT
jgi:hypothetical protein